MCSVRLQALFVAILLGWFPDPAGAENNVKEGVSLYQASFQGGELQALTLEEIGSALKKALHLGTGNVVMQLGRPDGYNGDPAIHISLPQEFQSVREVLNRFGGAEILDELELKLNRAAEVAAPKARALFRQAISDMTFADVETIYHGSDDSATRYFQARMSASLAEALRPIIEESLDEVGAVRTYHEAMGQYHSLPFVPDVRADLTEHVLTKGLEGLFFYMAREEAAIRRNPTKQTTALLRRVFGEN